MVNSPRRTVSGPVGWTCRARPWLLVLLLLILAAPLNVSATSPTAPQAATEIRGRVVDRESRPLPGVIVSVAGTARSTLTDRAGAFRLEGLPAGEQVLRLRMVGYREQEVTATAPTGALVLEIVLESTPLELPGVVATASPVGGTAAYQAAQVLAGERLERLSAASVGTLLEGQPGIASRYFGTAPARPVIRGFDGDRVIVLENGERMGDKQRAPDDAITLDPLAIDRIEIVRGPASLLYGSSAIGGVVNLFTRDLPEYWAEGVSGDFSLEAASVNEMRAGAARMLYGIDRWGFTARGSMRNGEDIETPAGVMPNSHLQTLAAATGVGYQSDRFRGGMALTFQTQRYGVPEFAVESDPTLPNRFVEVEPESENVIDRVGLQSRAEWNLERWLRRIEIRGNASSSNQEEGHDHDHLAPGSADEAAEDDGAHQQIRIRLVGSTVLLRHAPFTRFAEGALGFSFRYHHQEMEGAEAFHPGERLLSAAAFFFEEIPLRPAVSVQFGARLENEWTRVLPNALFPSGTVADASVSALNLSGSVGLNVRPMEGLEIGAQLARAHRNPSVVERYASGWHFGSARVEIGDPTLPSEIGRGFDLFGRFGGERLRLELAGFAYRIDNFVSLHNLPPGCGGIDYRLRPDRDFPLCVQYFSTNAEMVGGEALIEAAVTGTIRARAAADLVRGTRTDGAGEPLGFIPPPRLTLGLMHDAGSWYGGTTSRWVAAQNRRPTDELPTPGYSVLDFEAGLRLQTSARHTLSVRLENALNAEYTDHLSVIRRFPEPVSPDHAVRFPMPGRNLSLSYRYSF